MKNEIKYILVHHTGGSDANPLADTSHHTFDIINQVHKERFDFKSSLGWYVGYHYFINKNGEIKQARDDKEQGAHCIGYNNKSIGVCLAGNFDATLPTEAQKETLKTFLLQKQKEHNVPLENILPHRAFAKKTCFGKLLSDTWAQELLKVEEPIQPVNPPVEVKVYPLPPIEDAQTISLLQKMIELLKTLLGLLHEKRQK